MQQDVFPLSFTELWDKAGRDGAGCRDGAGYRPGGLLFRVEMKWGTKDLE